MKQAIVTIKKRVVLMVQILLNLMVQKMFATFADMSIHLIHNVLDVGIFVILDLSIQITNIFKKGYFMPIPLIAILLTGFSLLLFVFFVYISGEETPDYVKQLLFVASIHFVGGLFALGFVAGEPQTLDKLEKVKHKIIIQKQIDSLRKAK